MADREVAREPVEFGTLTDASLREAWAHEAHAFTPWLAENLDRLSTAIGVPLELVETEMRVGTFSADILARNPTDDSMVLVENQLEGSDHTHLGQILTYLAGLQANMIVWVAPHFREEHLSALRWLNEHTVDPFAFFAVKLRVVRIGDSPFAPLFEIIERPNNWDRQLAEKKRDAVGGRTELGQHRLDFWTHFCSRHSEFGEPDAASSRWTGLPNTTGVLVLYLAKNSVGLFVRPPRGESMEELGIELAPHLSSLSTIVSAPAGGETSFLSQSAEFDGYDRANWDQMSDWLAETARRYENAFQALNVVS